MKKINFILLMAMTVMAAHVSAQTLQLLWTTDTVFRVPESVLFDREANVLYVSNIDGKSNDRDGKGFISKLSPDGKIINLVWVTGLDAPKGMGLHNGMLYVADISRVIIFDVTNGNKISSIEIEGAEFLNDITVDANGNVYVSDSATGKIHKINNNKAELYFTSAEFKRINGLLALQDGLYIADAGTGKNYKLTTEKKLSEYAETAQGADGVVAVAENEYVVSSWGGEIYYVDASRKVRKLLDTRSQKLNSADIEYDQRTKTVFVPTFFGNAVMAYQLNKP